MGSCHVAGVGAGEGLSVPVVLRTRRLASHAIATASSAAPAANHANANLLLIAGHETTTYLIGNGLLALLNNPDQMQLLRNDLSRIPAAIEEFLRLVGSMQFTNRVALEHIDLGGRTIRKGDPVFLFLAAANPDPAHFPGPDRLDVTRSTHKHLAFGLGHHFCVGAPLARLEALIAFATILRRLPNLRLATDKFKYHEYFNLRGLNFAAGGVLMS